MDKEKGMDQAVFLDSAEIKKKYGFASGVAFLGLILTPIAAVFAFRENTAIVATILLAMLFFIGWTGSQYLSTLYYFKKKEEEKERF